MSAMRKLAVAVSLAFAAGTATAQVSDGVVKIGVLNDMSSLYADIGGPGSLLAAKMALEDYAVIPSHHQIASWALRKGLAYSGRVDEFTFAHEVHSAK